MYVLFLCFRYLRRRFSAIAAFGAVTFGVATLFTVLSVMGGYKVRLQELIRGTQSHLTLRGSPPLSLTGSEELEKVLLAVPHVVAAAPFIETVAMYQSFRSGFLQVRGIDPAREARVGDLAKQVLSREELRRIFPHAGAVAPDAGAPAVEEQVRQAFGAGRKPLAGEEVDALFSLDWRRRVREEWGARPAGQAGEGDEPPGALVVGINLLLDRVLFLGDEVMLIALSPDTGQVRTGTFIVAGAFKTGDFEVDSRSALAGIRRMETILGLYDEGAQDYRIEGMHIALDDYRRADATRRDVLLALARARAGADLEKLIAAAEAVPAFTEAKIGAIIAGLRKEPDAPVLQEPNFQHRIKGRVGDDEHRHWHVRFVQRGAGVW